MKEQRARKDFQAALQMKDDQLHNLLEKQKVLQDQLEKVKGEVPEIKQENLILVNEKASLEHYYRTFKFRAVVLPFAE